MFDGSLRKPFDATVAPIGRGLQRIGVSPDMITAVGVGMAGACAVAIGTGNFFTAFVLLLATGLPDALDGAVAKAGGTAGPRGAYLDSVSDRLSDGLLFAGAGWYLAGTDEPRMAMLPFALFIAASLVSYQRAKAESLGWEAKGGLMERAERFIALAVGLAFSSLFVPVLWLMLALTGLTVITRFIKVWTQATAARPGHAGDVARTRIARRQERISARQARTQELRGRARQARRRERARRTR
ncbi:MAG: CDP-alcohol phosphatidyltransferase family protein [Acidimicrobiales bacterium]